MRRIVAGLFLLSLITFYPVSQAKAQSIEDLQQQIQQLLATVAALQAQLGGVTGTCSANFTRDLSVGVSGADVLALQKFLNQSADTRLAVSGAGSPGMETMYYGPITANAVSKFQVKYRSEVLAPSGLVNGTGYFGPASRAKANALCNVVVPPIVTPTDPDDDDELEGGEARLESFSADDGDDTSVSEGQNDAPIMDVEFEVEDGDVQVDRIDVALDHLSGGDEDPWDVFETLSIWVDGEEVATMDVDDDDAWSEDEPESGDYRVRMTAIEDFIVREGDTAEFTVALSVAGNADDAGSVEWEMFIPDDGIRVVDSLDLSHYIGETNDVVHFEIDEAGADADLVIGTSSEDPDASVLQVKRSSVSDWLPIFAFELDADDSAENLTINELSLTVEVSDSRTYDALVRDARLVIDGEEYDDVTVSSGNTDTAVLTFDFGRNEVELDAGEVATAILELEFKALSESDEGTEVQACITSAQVDAIDAEGSEDLSASQLSGSATGEDHELRTTGSEVGTVETSAELKTNSSSTSDDDEGEFMITFELTAFEQDVYISKSLARGTAQGTAGINYVIEDGQGNTTEAGDIGGAVLDSSADSEGDMFRIDEGQTEEFTLIVEYDPTVSGFYKLQLYSINYNDSQNDPDTYQRAMPENTYQTDPLSI